MPDGRLEDSTCQMMPKVAKNVCDFVTVNET